MPTPRRPDRTPLHEVGEAPDYRFTLANERTLLAWVRTARYLGRHHKAAEDSAMGARAVRGVAAVTVVLSLASVAVILTGRG